MMARAGSNSLRGTANYQYWTNRINSLNPQQKLAFSQRPETGTYEAATRITSRPRSAARS